MSPVQNNYTRPTSITTTTTTSSSSSTTTTINKQKPHRQPSPSPSTIDHHQPPATTIPALAPYTRHRSVTYFTLFRISHYWTFGTYTKRQTIWQVLRQPFSCATTHDNKQISTPPGYYLVFGYPQNLAERTIQYNQSIITSHHHITTLSHCRFNPRNNPLLTASCLASSFQAGTYASLSRYR